MVVRVFRSNDRRVFENDINNYIDKIHNDPEYRSGSKTKVEYRPLVDDKGQYIYSAMVTVMKDWED